MTLFYWVVGRGPADDAPSDVVRYVRYFSVVEVSHVSANAFPVRSVIGVVVPDVVHVISP